jgi:DNA-binding SARP family transcriptional activator
MLSRDGVLEVDVVEFEKLAAAALAADDPDLLAEADLVYRGDLLPELPYADWALARREALRGAHHAVLVRLAQSEARSGHSEAAHLMLDRVLAEDATHEAAARASMRLLADVGRRSAALERYEMLREGLLQTYGTDPDDQSRELYRQILTAHGSVGRVRTAFVPSHRPTWPSPRGCGRRACW